jgi:hypothetical protein
LNALSAVGVEVITGADGVIQTGTKHQELVRCISSQCDSQFRYVSNCSFFPKLTYKPEEDLIENLPSFRRGEIVSIQLNSPLLIDGIENLITPIAEAMEENVYGSYVQIDKVYIYRTVPTQQPRSVSWVWHFDNHPREILKVMIYLTDVDEDRAPFEYLRDKKSLKAISGRPLAPLYGDSRIPAKVINRSLSNQGESCRVIGPAGTTILFDNNVIHTANLPTTGHRDVLIFQVRPALRKLRPRIDQRWTGSFQHAPFNLNPALETPIKEGPAPYV